MLYSDEAPPRYDDSSSVTEKGDLTSDEDDDDDTKVNNVNKSVRRKMKHETTMKQRQGKQTIRKSRGKRIQVRLSDSGGRSRGYCNHAFSGTADKGRKRVHDEVDADSSSLTTVSSLETTTQSTSVDVHHSFGTAEDHEPLNMLKMIFGYY